MKNKKHKEETDYTIFKASTVCFIVFAAMEIMKPGALTTINLISSAIKGLTVGICVDIILNIF
jgi:hypothetical protein